MGAPPMVPVDFSGLQQLLSSMLALSDAAKARLCRYICRYVCCYIWLYGLLIIVVITQETHQFWGYSIFAQTHMMLYGSGSESIPICSWCSCAASHCSAAFSLKSVIDRATTRFTLHAENGSPLQGNQHQTASLHPNTLWLNCFQVHAHWISLVHVHLLPTEGSLNDHEIPWDCSAFLSHKSKGSKGAVQARENVSAPLLLLSPTKHAALISLLSR